MSGRVEYGFQRVEEGLAESRMVKEGPGRSGKVQYGLRGSRKVWQGPVWFKRVLEDLTGSSMV